MGFEFKNFYEKIDSNVKEQILSQESQKSKAERCTKPIISCILDEGGIDAYREEALIQIEKDGQFVDYYGSEEFFKKNNIKNIHLNYAISECNGRDKYSKGYYDCTGIIIVGEKKENSEQTSLMSHQESGKLNKNFVDDLIKALKEVKEKTKEKSIDIVIFGGHSATKKYENQYVKSVLAISSIIKKELNFEPTVIVGPNKEINTDPTRVYLDTQNRRLFIVRPNQESKFNESYLPSDIKKQRKNWDS